MHELGFEPNNSGEYCFISYVSKNADTIKNYTQEMAKKDFNMWNDSGIYGGRSWETELADNIENCSCFILFVTNVALQKLTEGISYIKEEYEIATKIFSKPVCVVFMEKIVTSDLSDEMKSWYNELRTCPHVEIVEDSAMDYAYWANEIIRTSKAEPLKELSFADGKVKLTIEGLCVGDRPCGECKLIWQNSASGEVHTFEGEFKNGTRSGFGRYLWQKEGILYEGEFMNDVRSGKGKQTWVDGSRYIGEFKDNKRSGKGMFVWPSGNVYIGTFADNRFKEGTCYTPDMDITGEWREGVLYNGEVRSKDSSLIATYMQGQLVDGKNNL